MRRLLPEDRRDVVLRIERIKEKMKVAGMDAMLVSSNVNIYYTTALLFRGYVYMPVEGNAQWLVMRPALDLDHDVISIKKPEVIVEELGRRGIKVPVKLGMELGDLTVNQFERLRKCFPGAEISDATPILRECRMIKTEREIAKMKMDGVHQCEAYRRISKVYHENISDVEFQIGIERILRLEGSLGFLRASGNMMELNMGSVLVGDNADMASPYDFSMGGEGVDLSLPVGANGTIIRAGEAVMVDMNGNFNGYQTDMTRIWAAGELPDIARKAHAASLKILRTLEKEGKPGARISYLCELADEIVEEEGLQDYFMGHRQKAGFIGHGVGIELNEMPVIMRRNNMELQKNMTIALEPKFVIPKVGAVGAENTYYVSDDGLVNMTNFPEGIQELI